ncbi:hypothetical protein AB1Y20_014305 [Prymnesium parvum]|uniref:Large ribosomal subunit protein bL27c n=1 Tax=Prymnesium parvum TaxID=97485 RepID=A0AB34IEK9_PRYPA
MLATLRGGLFSALRAASAPLRALPLAPPGSRPMATKKSGGTGVSRSHTPKYLGVKVFGEQLVKPGGIIVRQRGQKFVPGENTAMGRDHTIFARVAGYVEFKRVEWCHKAYYYAHRGRARHFINVWPESAEENRARVRARQERRRARRAHLPIQLPKLRGQWGEKL